MKKLVTLALALLMVIGIAFPVAFNKEPVQAEAAENVKTADIYFIAGQSNAAGFTLWKNGSIYNVKKYEDQLSMLNNYNAYSDVLYYGFAGDGDKVEGGKLSTDLKPVNSALGMWSSAIGPELGMAHALQPLYANNDTTDAIIVKYAVGGSSLDGLKGCSHGNWGPPSIYNPTTHIGLNLYTKMMGTEDGLYEDGFIYDALVALKNKGYKKINFKGLFWAQGEADSANADRASAYNRNLSLFIKDFRADLVKLVETRMIYGFGVSFSDPSEMGFLLSEICVTFGGADKLTTPGYEGQSSNANIQRVLNAEREVATDTTSQYYVPNVQLLDTQNYVIKKTGAAADLVESNKGSFCYDNYHYSGDDMIEIGINAGTKMYDFTVGETVEVEKPEGFWIKINEKIAVRMSHSESVDVFQLGKDIVTVNKTYNGETLTAVEVSVNLDAEHQIDAVKYQLGNVGNPVDGTANGLVFSGNEVTVPSILLDKLATNSVVYVNVDIGLKPFRTITPTLQRVVLVEEVGGEYAVGDVVSFRVYLASAQYNGYVLNECSYNGTSLTPDADGVFTFTVDDNEDQRLVVKATNASFAGSNKIDYDLQVVSSGDSGSGESPSTPAPEKPEDGATSGGMNCAMGVTGEISIISIIALVGAVIVIAKRKFSVK